MIYNIISTGSKGNAVIIDYRILVDCGVSFIKLKPYCRNFDVVLLTHFHSDHFNQRTIRLLAEERPTLRFGCGTWMVGLLLACGVPYENIDTYQMDTVYKYSDELSVEPFTLYHNVENCGYKIYSNNRKAIYATDTKQILTEALDFDLYLIEANYGEEELQQRIEDKLFKGHGYIYELGLEERHLSEEQARDFIIRNIGINGKYEYLHRHKEREVFDEKEDAEKPETDGR